MKQKAMLFTLVTVLALGSVGFAGNHRIEMAERMGLTLEVNGSVVDETIYIHEGVSYVPLRSLADWMGAAVGWHEEDNTISLETETKGPELGVIEGTISSITKDERGYYHLFIEGESAVTQQLVGILSGQTSIENMAGDVELYAPDLAVGMQVTATFGPAMTMSLPPQSSLASLTVQAMAPMVFDSQTMEAENGVIEVPKVSGHPKAQVINTLLSEEANQIMETGAARDLQGTFQWTRIDQEVISGVYMGTMEALGSHRVFRQPFTFDLTTSKQVTTDDLVADDLTLREILAKEVIKQGLAETFEAEGLRFYLKGDEIVFFYYPLDDGVVSPVEVALSYDDLSKALKTFPWMGSN